MKALASEAGYFVAGVAMFLVFCIGFYLVWLFQTDVLLPLIGSL